MKVKQTIFVRITCIVRPRLKGRIEHFIARKAMDIEGLGEETVDLLFGKGLIKILPTFMSLRQNSLYHSNVWVKNRLPESLKA